MKKQSGFTLVEFMVAMGVSLVALAATMIAFKDATRSNQNVYMHEDMTDNIRAGMNLITQDLIETGTGIPTAGIFIPTYAATSSCSAGTSNLNRPTLSGAATFPTCNTVLPSIEPGNALGPFITSPDATSSVNTDILTVLYADNTAGSTATIVGMNAQPVNGTSCPGGSLSATGTTVTFDSGCFNLANLNVSGVQINPGDLIMFTNTNGNALQLVTAASGQTLTFSSGDAFGLNGKTSTATGGTILQLQNYTINASGNKVYNGTYPLTLATRVWMVTYYLDNVTDPTHVRLIRRVNFNPGQPVGETLENLQFTFNFNDGIMTNQSTVPAGYSENLIRSVNVYLGTRSTSRLVQNGQYARENFQTQVSLRSMAYVSRYN
jgi:prepilin-type N-terminal cleavage/methylation domain-containing protein